MTERFQYPFKENYEEIDGVRIHYVDEGSGPPILMVHGQPAWSYLYRKMIPPLVAAGYRCIAPDLMGFGLSDKPTDESVYTLRRHVELVTGLIGKLQLPFLSDKLRQDEGKGAVGHGRRIVTNEKRVAPHHIDRVTDEVWEAGFVRYVGKVRHSQVLVQEQVTKGVDGLLTDHIGHLGYRTAFEAPVVGLLEVG